MPGHLVMERLTQDPQQQSYRAIRSIFNLSTSSLEVQLDHSSLSSPPGIPCNTPQLCSPMSHWHRHAGPVTSGSQALGLLLRVKSRGLLSSTDRAKLVISRNALMVA